MNWEHVKKTIEYVIGVFLGHIFFTVLGLIIVFAVFVYIRWRKNKDKIDID
jgi:predicted solute-binding protein